MTLPGGRRGFGWVLEPFALGRGGLPGLGRRAFMSSPAANDFSAARGLELRSEAGPDEGGVGELASMVVYEAKVACTCVTLG